MRSILVRAALRQPLPDGPKTPVLFGMFLLTFLQRLLRQRAPFPFCLILCSLLHGSAKQAPSPLFCSVLACSGAPTKPTRFVCSAAPHFFFGRQATARPRKGGAACPRPGFLQRPVPQPAEGPEKNPENIRGRVSNKISALLEGLSLATCGPMHSQRPDCIGALHFAFASRPYRPCTCLSSDLLCAVRRLRPGFPAHEHDHPANADVSAVRTKSEVLVHAMRAETTEALVVCSEHVGSTPEQANAVLPVRLPLFGLVTRGVAEKE